MKKTVATLIAVTGLFLASATTAQAAAILVTTPLTIKFTDDVNPIVGSSSTLTGNEGTAFGWNVDGFGGAEFTFTTSLNHNAGFDRIFMDAPVTTLINKGNTTATRQLFTSNTLFGSAVNGLPSANFTTDSNSANIINRANGGTGLTILGTVVGFVANTAGYITFSFAGQNGTQFGWAQLTFNNGANGGITINQWGYETLANTPINVGDGTPVPEPSTYALAFGALALGIVAIRRRRS